MTLSCALSTAAQQREPPVQSALELEKQGIAALDAGDLQKAIRDFSQAQKLDPKNPELLAALGQAMLKAGDWSKATPPLEASLAEMPDHDEIRMSLAQCYQHLDQDSKVLQILDPGEPSHHRSPAWSFTLAFSLFRLGQYAKSEALFRQLLDAEGMRSAVSFFIANCRFGQGDLEGAVPWYQSAIRLASTPGTPALNAYYYDYGLALFRLRRFDQASAAFLEASNLNNSDPLAPYFLGRSQAETGQTQDAIEIFQKVVDAHPDFSPAYFQLGMLYRKTGASAQAQAMFAKVQQMKNAELEDERLQGKMQLGPN